MIGVSILVFIFPCPEALCTRDSVGSIRNEDMGQKASLRHTLSMREAICS